MISKQKKVELRIIRAFLRFAGYRFLRVAQHEKPDAMVTFIKDGKPWKCGIEQTEYHVDAVLGQGSPGRRISGVWHLIQASINRRISHRPQLVHTTGLVFLRKTSGLTRSTQQGLASELVRLALEFPVDRDGERTIRNFSSSYPLLCLHIREVFLQGTGCASNVSWQCGDSISSPIGLSVESLTSIVKQKTIESQQYSWNQADERWLLISASGKTVFNSAGRRSEYVNWSSIKLQSACQTACFDRIFFWDQLYNWCKEVWPGAPIIQEGRQYQKEVGRGKGVSHHFLLAKQDREAITF